MKRRILSIILAAGLVASVIATAAPVGAQAPEVPETLNIEDPAGDGNYLNDGTGFGQGGKDNTTPADASTVGDILAVWFTHTEDAISAHIQTEAPGPATPSYVYRVYFAAGGEDDCLAFQGLAPGVGNDPAAEPVGTLRSECGELPETAAEGEFLQEEGADGSGIHTVTLPRSAHEAFADDGVIAIPRAEVRHLAVAVTYPVIDNTEVGTDYTVTGVEEKAKKKDKKKKIKAKKRAKAKKKKKGRKKKAAQCKTFQPGELGAEADTIKITDPATEEKPVEQTVALDASLADFVIVQDPSRAYFNVQIDSKDPKVGLYALFEFPTRRDYDLELLHPDGSYAARSHDFNPLQETPAGDQGSNEGHGGESTASTEKLVGIGTDDCGGWTVEAVNWLGEGGEFPIKLWLGPVENEPQAEGEEPRE